MRKSRRRGTTAITSAQIAAQKLLTVAHPRAIVSPGMLSVPPWLAGCGPGAGGGARAAGRHQRRAGARGTWRQAGDRRHDWRRGGWPSSGRLQCRDRPRQYGRPRQFAGAVPHLCRAAEPRAGLGQALRTVPICLVPPWALQETLAPDHVPPNSGAGRGGGGGHRRDPRPDAVPRPCLGRRRAGAPCREPQRARVRPPRAALIADRAFAAPEGLATVFCILLVHTAAIRFTAPWPAIVAALAVSIAYSRSFGPCLQPSSPPS